MNSNMLRHLGKIDLDSISMPTQIRALFDSNPQVDIKLLDYDYVGEVNESDYLSFAKMLFENRDRHANYILVMHSNVMRDSRLLQKMFKFDLTDFNFTGKIETWSVSVFDGFVAFLGIITLNTFEDFTIAIRFLFFGIYDSQNFLISYNDSFTRREIMRFLEESLQLIKNRYGEIADMNLSIETICHHDRINVLYPYGGTDFGSLMLFILSKI